MQNEQNWCPPLSETSITAIGREDAVRLVGYCNFSQGAPDIRWRRILNKVYGELTTSGVSRVWVTLPRLLLQWLDTLSTESTFQDSVQARVVLVVTAEVLDAYLIHHDDLLHHLKGREAELFQPFFLARVIETVLQVREERGSQSAPLEWEQRKPGFVGEVLKRLNDFLGYRPLALLENRNLGEPYANERHRPVPVWLRDVGGSWGDMGRLVGKAMELLGRISPSVLAEAGLDLEQVEEVAVDMRAYDHGHPANLRPNHVFGEWDPAAIDSKGRYCRMVVRRLVLLSLFDWLQVSGSGGPEGGGTLEERETECAAVLGGTLLMAAGLVGGGPGMLDSSQSLSVLVPKVARLRDQYYHEALRILDGPHRARLEAEAKQVRQPFGRVRHFLNAWLARNRALQMQQRCLSLVYARLGFTAASTQEAEKIEPLSHRLMSRVLGGLKLGEGEVQRAHLERALKRIDEIRLLIQRGIRSGAFADPWNVLGFQGMFPLGQAREDATRDHRVDELLMAVEMLFQFGVMVWGEAAATGNKVVADGAHASLEELAAWWDPHATYRVTDARSVRGAQFLRTGERVSEALGNWRDHGEGTGELEFWKKRVSRLNTPQAYCLVLEALLRRDELNSAQGLLVHWVSRSEKVPLEDGHFSFERIATRFLVQAAQGGGIDDQSRGPGWLLTRFIDLVRANAGSLMEVEDLIPGSMSESDEKGDEGPDLGKKVEFLESAPGWDKSGGGGSAAGLAGEDESPEGPFDLEEVADELERRLEFEEVLGRLTRLAVRLLPRELELAPQLMERLSGWQAECIGRQSTMMDLALRIHDQDLPAPSSAEVDALMNFERRRSLRERLTLEAINATLEQQMASMALRSLDKGKKAWLATGPLKRAGRQVAEPSWVYMGVELEQAFLRGSRAKVRELLPVFLESFQEENLLYTPLAQGGSPEALLRTRTALTVLRALVGSLPRIGLLAETLRVLELAREMEIRPRPRVPAVTEFVHYYQSGLVSVVEAVVAAYPPEGKLSAKPESILGDVIMPNAMKAYLRLDNSLKKFGGEGFETGILGDELLVDTLEKVLASFAKLWVEHSRSGQMSPLENLTNDKDYADLRSFILSYGNDLFHTRFMTLANLRGILHRGSGKYLEDLCRQAETHDRIKLVRDIEEGKADANLAARRLELVLRTLVENYEEFKDYNTTTTLSDYGQNLHILIDFLALKASYDRRAWELRPFLVAHEQLARLGRPGAARLWAQRLEKSTKAEADAQVARLMQIEGRHAARLGTVRDKVEERFVKPMALDRICALVKPVQDEAKVWLASEDCEGASLSRERYACPALAQFQEEVDSFAVKPVGVGRDVPEWLRRLDAEIQRVQLEGLGLGDDLERTLRVPRVELTMEDWREEVERLTRPQLAPPTPGSWKAKGKKGKDKVTDKNPEGWSGDLGDSGEKPTKRPRKKKGPQKEGDGDSEPK